MCLTLFVPVFDFVFRLWSVHFQTKRETERAFLDPPKLTFGPDSRQSGCRANIKASFPSKTPVSLACSPRALRRFGLSSFENALTTVHTRVSVLLLCGGSVVDGPRLSVRPDVPASVCLSACMLERPSAVGDLDVYLWDLPPFLPGAFLSAASSYL